MHQTEPMEIFGVRAIVAQIIREEPVPHDAVQDARATLEMMCRQAAKSGLTTADIIRGVLHPVFEKKRGCDCSTCAARRNRLDQERPQRVGIPVA